MTTEEKRMQIIRFMEGKQRALEAVLGEANYFNALDRRELSGWSEDSVERVWRVLDRNSKKSRIISDTDFCPWCIRTVCSDCGYGRRHGICVEEGSDYADLSDNGIVRLLQGRGISMEDLWEEGGALC